jgi:nitric oxide reductase large subunit
VDPERLSTTSFRDPTQSQEVTSDYRENSPQHTIMGSTTTTTSIVISICLFVVLLVVFAALFVLPPASTGAARVAPALD